MILMVKNNSNGITPVNRPLTISSREINPCASDCGCPYKAANPHKIPHIIGLIIIGTLFNNNDDDMFVTADR